MSDRLKILLLSDHPLVPSGVGIQAKMMIEGLLKTGRYKFFCFGGAIQHPNYQLQQVAPEEFGEQNWMIQPVDGHGNKEQMRQALQSFKPDAVVIFTDPRFFFWIWEMEDEIRAVCPIVYWHVWDNDPVPDFNRVLYESTDFVSALSLKTFGLLQGIGYDKTRFNYIPHAEHHELFKPLPEKDVEQFKQMSFGPFKDKKFMAFWNNRNARRKMTGDVIESFVKFANSSKVNRKEVVLLMHTQPNDPEGQDIHALVKMLGAGDIVMLSDQRVSSEQLNMYYNCADVTVNISNNEGFGLSTLESLFSGTPIIVNFTGGLQFQVGDWWNGITDFSDQDKLTALAKKRWADKLCGWWGIPVFPATRNNVGSQQVPYIYDDRVNDDDVAKAFQKLYLLGRKERKRIGRLGREWCKENFNIEKMIKSWDEMMVKTTTRWRSERRAARVAVV